MATKAKKASEVPNPSIKPLALNRVDAAALLGMKRSTFENWNRDGRLGPESFLLGGGRRWDAAELVAWYEAGRPRREVWAGVREAEVRKSAVRHAGQAVA